MRKQGAVCECDANTRLEEIMMSKVVRTFSKHCIVSRDWDAGGTLENLVLTTLDFINATSCV